jgi:hypothetical protein
MLTFQVVRSRTRPYGYSIQAPPQITWVIGPGHTFGWFKRRCDAQQAVDVHNAADSKKVSAAKRCSYENGNA